jgi:diguanylate cyclase (GGDEF)-like protein
MSTTSIQLPFLQGDGFSRASRRIALAARKNQDLAVMLVYVRDIERLCASIGHLPASVVLDDFHAQLRAIGRDGDAIERLGERKFAVLLGGLRNSGHVSLAAQKIKRVASETVSKHVENMNLKLTIGVVLCPSQGTDAHELMRLAEIASLDARRQSTSVCFYETKAAEQLFNDWGLEGRLGKAIDAGDLELHYQPKISVRTGEVVGAEALMRWHEPEIGPISPDVFINLAESTGQIVDLTHFAIQRACRQLSEWQEVLPDLNVAVNITPSIIQTFDIVDVLKSATGIWGVRPEALTMEVTENALMADPETSHEVLTQIRDLGCRVSIDDFGTGYSSLEYLKKIPADELKIDRTFVMNMLSDPGDYKIVEHSIRIAESFGLSVVAEGVESAAMLDELRKFGCKYAQGYVICKPVPAKEFEEFCRNSRRALKASGTTS